MGRRSSRRWEEHRPPLAPLLCREERASSTPAHTTSSACSPCSPWPTAACSILNRRPSPFCDSASRYSAYDSCEPCPENGRCVDGELQCVHGFKKRGRICVEDGLLTHTVNTIAELLRVRICDEHARALCGQPRKILFQQLHAARLSDDGIKVVKDRVLRSAHGFLETTYDMICL